MCFINKIENIYENFCSSVFPGAQHGRRSCILETLAEPCFRK